MKLKSIYDTRIIRPGVLMWIIFILVLVVLVAYSLFFSGPGYLDGAVGNLLATTLGIILGVPAAISIQRRQENKEIEKAEQDAKIRRTEILQLLVDELKHNEHILSRRLQIENTKYPHPEIRIIVWQAFSSSGDIKWIDNPTLLTQIAITYHFLQLVNNDEMMWFKTEIARDPRQTWQSEGDIIRKHVLEIYPQVSQMVIETIKQIIVNS